MARLIYGGSVSDWLMTLDEDEIIEVHPNEVFTLWSEAEGGDPVTDILDISDTPIDVLVSDGQGKIPQFQGPDDSELTHLWVEFEGWDRRYLISPITYNVDLVDQITEIEGVMEGTNILEAPTRVEDVADEFDILENEYTDYGNRITEIETQLENVDVLPDLTFLRSSSSIGSTSTSFSCPAPPGIVEGDVLVAIVTMRDDGGGNGNPPTGGGVWNHAHTRSISGLRTAVWYRTAGPSEPFSYGLTMSSGATASVSVSAVANADQSAMPVVSSVSSGARGTTPGVTPTGNGEVELRWWAGTYDAPPPVNDTRTYNATWSASWYGFGKRSGTRLYQGNTQLGDGTGHQYGKIGFPASTIRSHLSGATITNIELRMSNEHSWFNNGLTARFGTHNNTSAPSGTSSTSGTFNRVTSFWNNGQTRWITLPNSIGNEFRDNRIKGITTGRPSAGNRNDYGYWRGWNASASQRPQLRISYTIPGVLNVNVAGPSGFAQRAELFTNRRIAAGLATRRRDSSSPSGEELFNVSHAPGEQIGLTVSVRSINPNLDPEETPAYKPGEVVFYGYRDTVLPVPSQTFTPVGLTHSYIDKGTSWSPGASGIQMHQPGKYLVSSSVGWGGSTAGSHRMVAVHVNGNPVAGGSHRFFPNSGTAARTTVGPALVEVSTSDVITVEAYQNSSGSLNTATSTHYQPAVHIEYVGPLEG